MLVLNLPARSNAMSLLARLKPLMLSLAAAFSVSTCSGVLFVRSSLLRLLCFSFVLKGMRSLDLFRASASLNLTPGPALDHLRASVSLALTPGLSLDLLRASVSLALTPGLALDLLRASVSPALTPSPALDLLFRSLSWALTSSFLDRFRASASLALTPSLALDLLFRSAGLTASFCLGGCLEGPEACALDFALDLLFLSSAGLTPGRILAQNLKTALSISSSCWNVKQLAQS